MLQPLYMLRDVLVRLVLLCWMLHDVSYAAAADDDDGDGRGDHYLGPLLYMAAAGQPWATARGGGRVSEGQGGFANKGVSSPQSLAKTS